MEGWTGEKTTQGEIEMRYTYSMDGSEPIVRDYPVYGTVVKGQVLAVEGAITTAVNRFALQAAAVATVDNVVGVAQESVTATTTAAATGVTVYGKVIINPYAIYSAEYSQLAADDTVNTSADTTGKVTTATFTTDREGDWIYVTAVGSTTDGVGNLSQIGASTSTTSVTAVTGYDDYLNGTSTSDTFICITNPFTALAAAGSINLAADIASLSGVAAAGTGAVLVLQNYITSPTVPLEPLKVARHSGRVFPEARFFADVWFSDHIMGGAPRIIT
jgi:hypothetical protein